MKEEDIQSILVVFVTLSSISCITNMQKQVMYSYMLELKVYIPVRNGNPTINYKVSYLYVMYIVF